MITTNLDFAEWSSVFGDAKLAKVILGKVDADEYDSHDYPIFRRWWMETNISHRGTPMPDSATQRAPRDGAVPFHSFRPHKAASHPPWPSH
jgi:hypothetical protein